ncbi:MAG: PadR family transcriptional regulator [Bryobacterales bacterium]|nr:PadR family transcriptional regulator [Bryobacterales bacterium]
MGSKADLLQGTLDLIVLRVLSLGPKHGYGIATRIRQISEDVLQVNQGSLYPALLRLEQRGWIKSYWGTTDTGREAKFFELTRAGRKQLAVESENWERVKGAIGRLMEAVE